MFGIADDGEVTGIEGGDVGRRTQDSITDLVTKMVTPLPSFALKSYAVEGKLDRVVLVLQVEQGDSPPYGVDRAKPLRYVRRGATTFPASSDQIRALARSQPLADQGSWNPYGLPGR